MNSSRGFFCFYQFASEKRKRTFYVLQFYEYNFPAKTSLPPVTCRHAIGQPGADELPQNVTLFTSNANFGCNRPFSFGFSTLFSS